MFLWFGRQNGRFGDQSGLKIDDLGDKIASEWWIWEPWPCNAANAIRMAFACPRPREKGSNTARTGICGCVPARRDPQKHPQKHRESWILTFCVFGLFLLFVWFWPWRDLAVQQRGTVGGRHSSASKEKSVAKVARVFGSPREKFCAGIWFSTTECALID